MVSDRERERDWLKFCLESSRLKLLFSMVSLLRSCAASCCTSFSLRSACLDVTWNTEMCQQKWKPIAEQVIGRFWYDFTDSWQKNRNRELAAECQFHNGWMTIAPSVLGTTVAIAINFRLVTRGDGAEIVVFSHVLSNLLGITIYYHRLIHKGTGSPYLHRYKVLGLFAYLLLHIIIIWATYQFCYIWICLSLQHLVKLIVLPLNTLLLSFLFLLNKITFKKIKLYESDFI